MKVLLIKPQFKNVFTKLSLIVTEPLELEYMTAICKKHKVESRICDFTVIRTSLKRLLRHFQPDIVAMTANFVHIAPIKKYVKTIKNYDPDILTIVGGPHAEVIPEDFQFEGIDIIIHSGGFLPFETIITDRNRDYGNIKGICYYSMGSWHKNDREQFRIDDLPFPDREHLYQNLKNYKYVTMKPCAIVKTSYSCPHHCNYCFSTLLNGGRYLCRDPKNVVEEIKMIDCDNIWIVDDTFYVDTQKLDMFIDLVKKEKIRKHYSLYFRADFIAGHPEYMKKLSEIGVSMCAVGLEVIDDEILQKYEKDSSVDIILSAIRILKECNITCIGLLMIDIDAEKSYFKKLYEFIKKYELYLSTISILTPMPGTAQYEKYKDRIVTNDYRKWDFVHLTINPSKMSRAAFYFEFYKLYVKLAMLILRKRILPFCYLGAAINASLEYWIEAIKGIRLKKE